MPFSRPQPDSTHPDTQCHDDARALLARRKATVTVEWKQPHPPRRLSLSSDVVFPDMLAVQFIIAA